MASLKTSFKVSPFDWCQILSPVDIPHRQICQYKKYSSITASSDVLTPKDSQFWVLESHQIVLIDIINRPVLTLSQRIFPQH